MPNQFLRINKHDVLPSNDPLRGETARAFNIQTDAKQDRKTGISAKKKPHILLTPPIPLKTEQQLLQILSQNPAHHKSIHSPKENRPPEAHPVGLVKETNPLQFHPKTLNFPSKIRFPLQRLSFDPSWTWDSKTKLNKK